MVRPQWSWARRFASRTAVGKSDHSLPVSFGSFLSLYKLSMKSTMRPLEVRALTPSLPPT
jgi:hypothetical protein